MQQLFVNAVRVHKRTRLPHWETKGIYSLTFNLFDAVPIPQLARLRAEAEAERDRLQRDRGRLTIAEQRAIAKARIRRIERILDLGHGSAFMRSPDIAELVAKAFLHFDAVRYELLAWCVMPNHVHVIAALDKDHGVATVVKSWKSFTGRTANKLLSRVGEPFWHEDYFDRTLRRVEQLRRWLVYVTGNPAKAGMRDWPFVRSYPERVKELLMI